MKQSVRKTFPIKLLSPSVSEKEIRSFVKVLRSGWWGPGPITERFEQEFAKFVGAKYAVAVNSCTAALHLCLKVIYNSSKIKNGEVIAPALTFVSSAGVALYEGLKVIFADINEQTLTLDPADVQRKINQKTVAVIPVHYGGNLAVIDYAEKIPVIEDCAHAAGTISAGIKGVAACWSFHPVKNIATGDGGMITTDDRKLYEKVKRLRWFGISATTHERLERGYNWEYDIEEFGYKYNPNDINSAIGLVQLKRIRELNRKRRVIAQKYLNELKNLPLRLPPDSGSWHLFVIRVEAKWRNKIIEFLRTRGISSGVHYKPLYKYKFFNWNIKDKDKGLPVTEKAWQEIISLPIYPDLTVRQQEAVIKALKKFFK